MYRQIQLALHAIHVILSKVEIPRDRVRIQVWIGHYLVTVLGSEVKVKGLTTADADEGVVAVNLMTTRGVVRLD